MAADQLVHSNANITSVASPVTPTQEPGHVGTGQSATNTISLSLHFLQPGKRAPFLILHACVCVFFAGKGEVRDDAQQYPGTMLSQSPGLRSRK